MCINERFINCTHSCYFKDCLALLNDYAVVTVCLILQRLSCSSAAITLQHLGFSSPSTLAAIYTLAPQCCPVACSIPQAACRTLPSTPGASSSAVSSGNGCWWGEDPEGANSGIIMSVRHLCMGFLMLLSWKNLTQWYLFPQGVCSTLWHPRRSVSYKCCLVQ